MRTPTSTTRENRLSIALLLCVLGLVLASTIAPLAAGATPATRDADLVVDQPHYVDKDVSVQETNGSRVYVARGEVLDLYPQNFDAANVVDYGTTTENATLSYDDRTKAFTLEPGGTGTYEVYFVVERPVDDGNATANGSDTRQYRYTARIRVAGQTDLVHRETGSLDDMEQAAANWREFNQTMHQRDLVGAAGIGAATEEAINWYELHPTNDPLEALTGSVLGALIILFTSTAILIVIAWNGWHMVVVRKLRRKLHIHEAVEAEEGTAKEAIARLDSERNERELQNMDWQDLPGFDDQIAAAFRETLGETVHDGTVTYLEVTLARNLVRDRLQAMGHDGYVAVCEGWLPVDFRIEHGDDVAGDATTVDLAEADDDTLAAVRDGLDSWDVEPLRSFDLPGADYEVGDLDTTYGSMDLADIADRLDADMRHFEDQQAFGEYLREFIASVEQSPFCDDQGRPDNIRYVMSHFLKHAQFLGDRFNFREVRYHREAIERALIDFDPEREAREVVDRVQGGGV